MFKVFFSDLAISHHFSSPGHPTELVIPVEICMPSFRTSNFDKESNEIELRLNLDLLDEKKEMIELHQEAYKCKVAKYYNRRVKHQSFFPSDLVLRKVTLSTKEPSVGKLGPTWEGPYKVIKVSRSGPTGWKTQAERHFHIPGMPSI
ncbi:hypothetical protein Acr_00g0014690 [Actinidia rufa]|uniref:Reverse transcriptase domain-containing protein n=1 Tax=Actinidia rufa TaxID=165716 RepID=A0A7J0DAD1_9ERIC|nr:hypothetical protein Acr_00g0014690 [Actinidia rufa]